MRNSRRDRHEVLKESAVLPDRRERAHSSSCIVTSQYRILCVHLFVRLSCRKAPAPFDTDRMSQDFKLKDFPNQVFAKNQPFFYQTEGKPILLARVTGLEGAWLSCTAVLLL